MSETVSGETVDDAEGVAELIIEAWSDDADRQRMTHVADTFADVVPDVRNFPGARAVLEVDENRGHAGARETAQEVKIWRFLQRALESFGDLLEHVVDAGAGPRSLHYHRFNDERRVFIAPEPHEGEKPRQHRNDHQVDGQRPVLERPFRKVEAHITAPTRAAEPSGQDGGLARLQ